MFVSSLTAAADEQGLSPMCDRLTAEGVAFGLANTGGYCMLIEIPLDGQALIGITRSETPGDTRAVPRWLVIAYPDWDAVFDGDSHTLGSALTTGETITSIRTSIE